MKFRKKPVVVEAMRYTGYNDSDLWQWSNGAVTGSPVMEPTEANPLGYYVQIATLEGTMIGNAGDWIIRGVKGEFYPCKPDIFAATYEPVEDIHLSPEASGEGGEAQ